MSYPHDKPHYHLDPQDFFKDVQNDESSSNQNKQNEGQQTSNKDQSKMNMGQSTDRSNTNQQKPDIYKGA